MAFASVSEWDVDAADNTEIDGISLAENVMRPPAVNNAFREMMSQIASYTRHGSDLSNSTGTLNLDSIDAMFLNITGTTTVTAATLTEGHSRRARAVSAFQLTASASLVVNGSTSSNYTTSAGDLLFFEGYGSSVVRVWSAGATSAATTSAAGIVELATQTEAATLTDTSRAITADGMFFLGGYTTTATAAGTTTLTVTSTYNQYFSGTTTQTLVLPVTSTLVLGRSFRVVNNSTGAVTVQSSGANTILILAAGAAAILTCILVTGTTAASWDYRPIGPVLGTSQASTSGTALDFTGIPAWAKRIFVMFTAVSTNGTSPVIIQIGDTDGIENTSYSSNAASAGGTVTAQTSGFAATVAIGATSVLHGIYTLSLTDPSANSWVGSTNLGETVGGSCYNGGGSKSLSAVLDRVRVTMVNGTDTFDAGKVNIMYD